MQETYRCEPVLTPLLFALPGLLVLASASLELVSNGLLTLLLSLLLVDGLHQHTLVLEHITLDLQQPSRHFTCRRMDVGLQPGLQEESSSFLHQVFAVKQSCAYYAAGMQSCSLQMLAVQQYVPCSLSFPCSSAVP